MKNELILVNEIIKHTDCRTRILIALATVGVATDGQLVRLCKKFVNAKSPFLRAETLGKKMSSGRKAEALWSTGGEQSIALAGRKKKRRQARSRCALRKEVISTGVGKKMKRSVSGRNCARANSELQSSVARKANHQGSRSKAKAGALSALARRQAIDIRISRQRWLMVEP